MDDLVKQFAVSDAATSEAQRVAEAYFAGCVALDEELYELVQNSGRRELERLIREELFAVPQAAAGEPDTPELRDRLNQAREDFNQRMEESGLAPRVRKGHAEALRRNLQQVDELQLELASALGLAAANEAAFLRAFRRALVLSGEVQRGTESDFWRIGDCVHILKRFVAHDPKAREFIWCEQARGAAAPESAPNCELVDNYYLAIDEYCRSDIDGARETAWRLNSRPGEASAEETARKLNRLRSRLARRLEASQTFGNGIDTWLRSDEHAELADSWIDFWQRSLAPRTCAPLWAETHIEGWLKEQAIGDDVRSGIVEQISIFRRDQAALRKQSFEIALTLARKHIIVNSGDDDAVSLRRQLLQSFERRTANHETFIAAVANWFPADLRDAFLGEVAAARRSMPLEFTIKTN